MNFQANELVVRFDEHPKIEKLAAPLAYGVAGTSNVELLSRHDLLKFQPKPIPILGVILWLYFVLLAAAIAPWFTPFEFDRLHLGMLIFAALVIVPCMVALFVWINRSVGGESYLIWDRSNDSVLLPRISYSCLRRQIQTVVFLDRFVGPNRFFQVALLVRTDNGWDYVHLCNAAGASGRPTGWAARMGFKDFYHEVAESLDVEFKLYKYSRKQSKELD